MRHCAYCRFEIPWDATVCGHCGRDNEYRWSTRQCLKHGIVYEGQENVHNTDVFTEKCPQCSAEEKDRQNRIAQAKAPLGKEIEEKERQLHELYTQLQNNVWHNAKVGGVFAGAAAFAVPAAVVSVIIALASPLTFASAFTLVYGGGWAIAIWMAFPYHSLKAKCRDLRSRINVLRDEMSRIQ